MFVLHGATTQRVFFAHPLHSGSSASPGNQTAPCRPQLLARSVRPATIIMCWYIKTAKHNFCFRENPALDLAYM